MRPREVDGLLDVGDTGTARDQGGSSVDVPVPHPSRRLVAAVIAADELTAERAPQTVDVRASEGDVRTICSHRQDIRHHVTSMPELLEHRLPDRTSSPSTRASSTVPLPSISTMGARADQDLLHRVREPDRDPHLPMSGRDFSNDETPPFVSSIVDVMT